MAGQAQIFFFCCCSSVLILNPVQLAHHFRCFLIFISNSVFSFASCISLFLALSQRTHSPSPSEVCKVCMVFYLMWPGISIPSSFCYAHPPSELGRLLCWLHLSGTSKDQLVVTSVFPLSSQQQKLLHCPRHSTPCRMTVPLQLRTTSMSKYMINLSERHRSQEVTLVPINALMGRKYLQEKIYYWSMTNWISFVSLLSKTPWGCPGALLNWPLANLHPCIVTLAAAL